MVLNDLLCETYVLYPSLLDARQYMLNAHSRHYLVIDLIYVMHSCASPCCMTPPHLYVVLNLDVVDGVCRQTLPVVWLFFSPEELCLAHLRFQFTSSCLKYNQQESEFPKDLLVIIGIRNTARRIPKKEIKKAGERTTTSALTYQKKIESRGPHEATLDVSHFQETL